MPGVKGLQGLRALLIRPKSIVDVVDDAGCEESAEAGGNKGADRFSHLLSGGGATLYHYPVMSISALESPASVAQIKAHILNFAHYDRAIFISKTAATLAMDWLAQYCAMVPEGLPLNMEYYAVGKSTANALSSWGVQAEVPEKSWTSEGLLALPSLQHIADEKLVIFCGKGGRTLLAEELTTRGATVSRCELYQRQITREYEAQINGLLTGHLADKKLDVVIAHSGELLDHLLGIIYQGKIDQGKFEQDKLALLKALPVLVPSERVKQYATESGFEQVICAHSAKPEDMVSALQGWYSN